LKIVNLYSSIFIWLPTIILNIRVMWKTSITQLANIFNNRNVMEWYDTTAWLVRLLEQGKLLHPTKQVTGCTCIAQHGVNKISVASENKHRWTSSRGCWLALFSPWSDFSSYDHKPTLKWQVDWIFYAYIDNMYCNWQFTEDDI